MEFGKPNLMWLLRFAELALVICCVIFDSFSYTTSDLELTIMSSGTFIGYVIIVGGIVIAMVLNWGGIPKEIFLVYYAVGIGLFITTGILSLHHYNHAMGDQKTFGITKGAMAIAEGALFAVDVFFAYRGQTPE